MRADSHQIRDLEEGDNLIQHGVYHRLSTLPAPRSREPEGHLSSYIAIAVDSAVRAALTSCGQRAETAVAMRGAGACGSSASAGLAGSEFGLRHQEGRRDMDDAKLVQRVRPLARSRVAGPGRERLAGVPGLRGVPSTTDLASHASRLA